MVGRSPEDHEGLKDPITGKPLIDSVLSPLVVGEAEEDAALPADDNYRPTHHPPRGKVGTFILIDFSNENWEEEATEAYRAARKRAGFDD